MKTKTREFIRLKKDVENEIKRNVKYIAIYADNLTKEEAITVDKYLKAVSVKYDIDYHIYDVRNVLHNNTKFYKHLIPENSHLGWMAVELTNVIYCDEVWVFDNGYDNYKFDSRLDNILTQFEKPVRFLAKTPDNKSWDFYKGRDVIRNNADEFINNYYLIVDEYSIIMPKDTKLNGKRHLRPISKTVLSEKEYDLVFSALQISQFMDKILLKAIVRNDNELISKIKPFIRTSNEIIIDILTTDNCSDEILNLCEGKLDFAAPDVEKLINDYQL